MKAMILCSAMTLLLGGCSTGAGTMMKSTQVGDSPMIAATADLRFIIARPKAGAPAGASAPVGNARGSTFDPYYSVCAEPSPDVAKAISDALAESASATAEGITALGPKADLSAGQSFALTQNTSISELGRRLATTQVLRDGVYRLCESFANGAIDKHAYSLALSRYGDTMVTLLAIEAVSSISHAQLPASATSVATPPPTPPAPKPPAAADANKADAGKGDAGAAGKGTAAMAPSVAAPAARIEPPQLHKIKLDRASLLPMAAAGPKDTSKKVNDDAAADHGVTPPATDADDNGAGVPAAIVALQAAYLKQSRFAPLFLLCATVLGDPADKNASAKTPPESLRDVCLSQIPRIIDVMIQAQAVETQVASAAIRPSAPAFQKPPAPRSRGENRVH